MRTLVVVIMISAFLASCAFSAKKKSEAISALEESLKASSKNHIVDTVKLRELLADYEYYYGHYPKDSLSPIFLMKSGNFNRALGNPAKAVECYHRVYTEYPDYPKANFGLFLEGYTYENDLHNLPKAKEAYEAYLKKYPDSKMANDVQFLIEHLGKTPEQIMAEVDSIRKARHEPEQETADEPQVKKDEGKAKTGAAKHK
ncbi:MAG: hypothetical protein JWO03_2198 [Bacteroidetes bacterium]|nr:hypothetical protein [Bacteroidota bacterium]